MAKLNFWRTAAFLSTGLLLVAQAMKAKFKHLIFQIEWWLMSSEERFAYLWDDKKPSLRKLLFHRSQPLE